MEFEDTHCTVKVGRICYKFNPRDYAKVVLGVLDDEKLNAYYSHRNTRVFSLDIEVVVGCIRVYGGVKVN